MRLLRLTTLVLLTGFALTACSGDPIAPETCSEPDICGFPTNGN